MRWLILCSTVLLSACTTTIQFTETCSKKMVSGRVVGEIEERIGSNDVSSHRVLYKSRIYVVNRVGVFPEGWTCDAVEASIRDSLRRGLINPSVKLNSLFDTLWFVLDRRDE